MDNRFVSRLIDLSTLMQREPTLDGGLRELARLAAETVDARRCSVMLVSHEEEAPSLRLCSHFGPMPADAYTELTPLDRGIAGHVATSGEGLLVTDITRSPFAHLARPERGASPSLVSAPVTVGDLVIGVINGSEPRGRAAFTDHDLAVLNVLALFVGRSIQVFQLQRLAESRLLQMAQILDRRDQPGAHHGPICPDPGRLAKLVARNFYRELAAAGFGPNDIISVSSQVLSELNENLGKHRARLARHGTTSVGPPREGP
jgi:GAF domain-containing protein